MLNLPYLSMQMPRFLLIPAPLNLCKVHISGFYIPLNGKHLCNSGIPKKVRFSTSPIEYRLCETKKLTQ